MERNGEKRTRLTLIKGNKGSSVVELCLIFPIIIWTVFFVIYLFIGELNQGIAIGNAYEKLYNRETYIYNNSGQAVFEEVLEEHIESDLRNRMSFLEGLEVSTDFIREGNSVFHNLEGLKAGNLQVTVSYETLYPGISKLVEDPVVHKSITSRQEIRDTANNLRRWQLYGQILSD